MKPHVMIELDKPRRLRFDYNSICDAEEMIGLGVAGMFSKEKMGLYSWRILLWAGLKWADPKLTPEKAGKLINSYLKQDGELDELILKLQEALEESGLFKFAEEEEDEEGNPQEEAETE